MKHAAISLRVKDSSIVGLSSKVCIPTSAYIHTVLHLEITIESTGLYFNFITGNRCINCCLQSSAVFFFSLCVIVHKSDGCCMHLNDT